MLRSVFDDLDGDDGYVSLEVDPDLAFDSDRTIAQAREYWARVDRPNVMIKIPGTTECLPAIEQAIYEGINVNVTLLFSVEAYDDGRRGVHQGPRAPPRRGPGPRRALGRVVLRLARGLRGRQAPGGDRPRATCRARRRSPTRAPPTGASRRSSAASASPTLRAAGAHVQRPLWASTGVKNPAYKETKYVEELVGPDTVNTMPMQTLLACAERLEVDRRDRARGPDAGARRARRGRHRHGRRHRQAPARGRRRVRHADGEAAGRHRGQARGDLHRPPGDDRLLAARRARAARPRARQARRARARRAADLVQGRHAVGPGRAARGRRPARLADRARDLRGRRSTTSRRSPRRSPRRATPTRCCSAWAARASRPRCCGAPTARRPARPPAPARARLDRPRRGARPGARGRPRAHAVSRLDEVRRHDRDDLAVRALLERCARTASSSSRSPTRARRCRRWPPSAASGARSATTPTSAGATAR